MQTLTILTQNENGPCPLVALVNTMLLSEASRGDGPSTLASYITGKDEVEIDQVLAILADSALERKVDNHGDVKEVLRFLPLLVTGLNVNLKFDGTFADTPEMALFRIYDVDVVHGWVCDAKDPQQARALEVDSYDESQSLLVRYYEGHANPQETELAISMESFIREYPTQLTPYGLQFLSDLLEPGSFAVFFRNDHFSTLYRARASDAAAKLFTLVTDTGFRRERHIVWQSVLSVTGADDNFYGANFAEAHSASVVDDDPAFTASSDRELARQIQEEEDHKYAVSLEQHYRGNASGSANARNSSTQPASKRKVSDKKGKKDKCCIM
jgi:hypothetical protein